MWQIYSSAFRMSCMKFPICGLHSTKCPSQSCLTTLTCRWLIRDCVCPWWHLIVRTTLTFTRSSRTFQCMHGKLDDLNSCSVSGWFPHPPTGWVISGGDEEDPKHAGNSGERIWEGGVKHFSSSIFANYDYVFRMLFAGSNKRRISPV